MATAISERLVSKALKVTAVVNIGAGLAAMSMPDLNAQLLLGAEVTLEGHLLRYHLMVWSFVVAMGLGYAVASRAPERARGILLAGGAGKLVFALICVEMLWSGHATWLLLGATAFDGLMGALFLAYFFQTRASAEP